MISRAKIEVHDTKIAAQTQANYYKNLGYTDLYIHGCSDVEWVPKANPAGLPAGTYTESVTITHSNNSDVWVLVASK